MDRKAHQLGGILLLLAGLAGVVGGVLQAPQPGPLGVLAELSGQWRISEIAIGVAGALFVISTLLLARHFAGAAGEGWALLGTGTLFLGGVALLGISAWETRDFSGLLAAQEAGAGFPAEQAFLASTFFMSHMAKAAMFLLPTAITVYGLSMLKASGWPSWLAWIGIVIGVPSLTLALLGVSLGAVVWLPLVLGNLWFATVGIVFMGRRRAATTVKALATEQPPETLRDRLEQGKPLSIGDALDITRKVVAALDCAHKSDAVDREIEPGSIDLPPEVYPPGAIPEEMFAGEPAYLDMNEALDDQSTATSGSVRFEYAADDEEYHVGSQPEAVPPIAGHMTAADVRSRVFGEWLSGPHYVQH